MFKALNQALKLWNSRPDCAGDERNVVLTLSRIWYSASTGKIAPKDVAADWAMEHLPARHRRVLLEATQAYLGQEEDRLAARADELEELVRFMKARSRRYSAVVFDPSFTPMPLCGTARDRR